jgi:hypothetical protein
MRISVRFWTLLPLILSIGCESQIEESPAKIDATLSDADRDALSSEVRRVYDAMVAGTLVGAQAADYQAGLDQADEVRGANSSEFKSVTYVWNALAEDRSAEYEQRGEAYEGPPFMFVRVQKKYGQIYQCGIGHPCY